MRQAAIRFAMNALYFSGAHRTLGERHSGIGLIFTMHHVRPAQNAAFQPNRPLEITPEFLERTIILLKRKGLEFVSLDEAHRRIMADDGSSRFACLTFDDGYRDNFKWAYPVLKRYGIPFTIFVTAAFADGTGHLWWRTLETAISANRSVTIEIDGHEMTFVCGTTAEKYSAVRSIGQALASLGDEAKLRAAMENLAARLRIDTAAACSASCMSWRELAQLATDPLVTIGAHTMSHPKLRTLDTETAHDEIKGSIDRIERALGTRPEHLAYPYGDASAAGEREFAIAAKLGLKTALTTRPGVLSLSSRERMTRLPRISLNGEFQRLRYVDVLTSGAASLMWNRFGQAQQG